MYDLKKKKIGMRTNP